MMLTPKEREEAFSIHIDLGKTAKGKVTYPLAFIESVPGLDQMPEKGCALVEYVRHEDGSFELRRFCLAENSDEGGEYGEEDLGSALGDGEKSEEDE